MAEAYKYSQVQGTASTGTYVTLYNTGASASAVVSSLVICNQSSSGVTVRIGLTTSAGTPTAAQFLVHDFVVSGNDTVSLTLGITLDASKFIRVSSSANTCSFTSFVSEIT